MKLARMKHQVCVTFPSQENVALLLFLHQLIWIASELGGVYFFIHYSIGGCELQNSGEL